MHLISHVLPMLVRAYDDTDARLQEEVLKKTVSLAKQLDVQVIASCNLVDNLSIFMHHYMINLKFCQLPS